MLNSTNILLVISGGIAAYKSLDLIRRLRESGARVRCVLSVNAPHFVTPMSVAALSEERVFSDMFSLTEESEMGHIRLSREADLVVVAPATADLIAKMAHGLADDLASTVLLASTAPILIAPAMNTNMWKHPATQTNVATLKQRGVLQVGPGEGELACGDTGPGRMAEPLEILESITAFLCNPGPLSGRRAIVTSGPTHEPIDPVRYLGNRSSGKQGHAIAAALAALGADTTLVSGPTAEADPRGVSVIRVETARAMFAAVESALPADIAVCAAAVADWRPRDEAGEKIKKDAAGPPTINLVENPDILAFLASLDRQRPALVVGFAAETSSTLEHAAAKRQRKGCDWIVANDVSDDSGVFGGEDNQIHLVTPSGTEDWPRMSKVAVAKGLAQRIARHFE